MKRRNTEIVTARVTSKTKQMIAEFIRLDTHLNESDFLRAAIREKLRNDAPDLFEKMMKQEAEPEN